jgi:uncharacterized protein YcaQ
MNVHELRQFAITHSLFKPTSLKKAMDTLGFVQADPIRAPARAQDLILRNRVLNYHVNDLDANYAKLKLEEDFLYAYGFFSPKTAPIIHPKNKKKLSSLETKLLEFIKKEGHIHPKDLEKEFGKKTERNWWGGNSKTTKMALDQPHYYGFIRIAGRTSGIRTYEAAPIRNSSLSPDERAQQLALLIISILQPVTDVTFRQSLNYIRYFMFDKQKYTAKYIQDLLLKNNLIKRKKIDNLFYSWIPGSYKLQAVPTEVKFMAPFDPVVWDRARFEHLWGWPYRFEAYTPPAKRIRGYYSLPLLWKDEIPGWVNIKRSDGGVHFEVGFVNKKPKDKQFDEELEKEKKRFTKFLIKEG